MVWVQVEDYIEIAPFKIYFYLIIFIYNLQVLIQAAVLVPARCYCTCCSLFASLTQVPWDGKTFEKWLFAQFSCNPWPQIFTVSLP